MGLGALRTIFRPLSRTLALHSSSSLTNPLHAASTSTLSEFRFLSDGVTRRQAPWIPIINHFHSLTETRFPKRRPSDKPRRKRASMKPPGPYAWVMYTPGEPILANRPNEGSLKGRNEKKRRKLRREFILAEKKKRKILMQEAKKKKVIMRVERKMAAVARERAWAQRLVELQQLEEEKNKSKA